MSIHSGCENGLTDARNQV